jgi:hypothetical protein
MKMPQFKVVHRKNLPASLPIFPTMTFWLILDRLHAPQWLWGVIGTILVLVWILRVIAILHTEMVELDDIFDWTKERKRRKAIGLPDET